MEREFKAEAIIVRQICDRLGCDGEMIRSENASLMPSPHMYPHTCNKCWATGGYEESYPMTKFREINEG